MQYDDKLYRDVFFFATPNNIQSDMDDDVGRSNHRVTSQQIVDGLPGRIPEGQDGLTLVSHIRKTMRNIRNHAKKHPMQYQKTRDNYGVPISDATIDALRNMHVDSKQYHEPVNETIRSYIHTHNGMPSDVIDDVARIFRVRIKSGVIRKIRSDGVPKKADQLNRLRQYLSESQDTSIIHEFVVSGDQENIPEPVQSLIRETTIDANMLQNDTRLKHIVRLYAKKFREFDRVMHNGKVYNVASRNGLMVELDGDGGFVNVNTVTPHEKSGRVGKITKTHEKIISLIHIADNSVRASDVIKYLESENNTTEHRRLILLCMEGGFVLQRKTTTDFPYSKFSDLDYDEENTFGLFTGVDNSINMHPHKMHESNIGIYVEILLTRQQIIIVAPDVVNFLKNRNERFPAGTLSQMDISRARKALHLTYTKMQTIASERDTPKLNTLHDLFVQHFVKAFREGVNMQSYNLWVKDLQNVISGGTVKRDQKELVSLVRVMTDIFLEFMDMQEFSIDQRGIMERKIHGDLLALYLGTTTTTTTTTINKETSSSNHWEKLIFMDATSIYLDEGSHMGWSEAGKPAIETVRTQRGLGTKVLASIRWPDTSACQKTTQDLIDLSYVQAKCGGNEMPAKDWCYMNKSFCVDVYTPRNKEMSLFNFETFARRAQEAEDYVNNDGELGDMEHTNRLEAIKIRIRVYLEQNRTGKELKLMQTFVLVHELKNIIRTEKNQSIDEGYEETGALQSMFGVSVKRSQLVTGGTQIYGDSPRKNNSNTIAGTSNDEQPPSTINGILMQQRQIKLTKKGESELFVKAISDVKDFTLSSWRQIEKGALNQNAKDWVDIEDIESNFPFRVSESMIKCDYCSRHLKKLQLFRATESAAPNRVAVNENIEVSFDIKNEVDELKRQHVITISNAMGNLKAAQDKYAKNLDKWKKYANILEDRAATISTVTRPSNAEPTSSQMQQLAQHLKQRDDAKNNLDEQERNVEKLQNDQNQQELFEYIVKVTGTSRSQETTTRMEFMTGNQFMNEYDCGEINDNNSTSVIKLLHHAKVHQFADQRCRAYKVNFVHYTAPIYIHEDEVCKSGPFTTYMMQCGKIQPIVKHPDPGKIITHFRNSGVVNTSRVYNQMEQKNEQYAKLMHIYNYKTISVGDRIDEIVVQIEERDAHNAGIIGGLMGLVSNPSIVERVFGPTTFRKFSINELDTLNIRNNMNKVENITKSVYARYIIGELIWRFDLNTKFLVHDGASYFMPHNDEMYQLMLNVCGCHMVTLPAYSPEFNPIEMVFGLLKHRVKEAEMPERDYVYLKSTIFGALNSIHSKTIKNFFYHDMYSAKKFNVDVDANDKANMLMTATYKGVTRGSRTRNYAEPFAIIFTKPSNLRRVEDIRESRLLVVNRWRSDDFVGVMKTMGLDADDFSIYRYSGLDPTLKNAIVKRIQTWPIDDDNQVKYQSLGRSIADIKTQLLKTRDLYFLKKRRFQMRLR